MKRTFGERVAAELQARAPDRGTFEELFEALDGYPSRGRDRHRVARMPGRAAARLTYRNVDVCAFYVRKGQIVVHPRSADIELFLDLDSAVDRMAVLLAHAILECGDDAEADEAPSTAAAGSQVVKLAEGRRS